MRISQHRFRDTGPLKYKNKMNYSLVSAIACLLTAERAYSQDLPEETLLDPIVINGDLIAQPWLRTGTSAEVLDEETLDERPAVDSVRDILENTPNISMQAGTAKAPTIRGVDGTGPAENANAFFAGSRPRMGVQIDGRPASYNEIVFGNSYLWDVERVEVLRGPQSTLVGRNAIAGTVSVKTKDPTYEYSGALETSIGNNMNRRVSGMINIPIIDQIIAARLSADWQTSESAVNYQSYSGVDNPGDIESLNLRGKLLVEPDIADGSELLLTLTHNKYKSPQAEIIVRPFDERVSNYPEQPVHEPATTSIGAEFFVDLDDRWRLELDASATDFNFERLTAPNGSAAKIETVEFSADPRVRFDAGNGFEALIGAHAYHADQEESILYIQQLSFDDQTSTYALYGEAIVPLGDQFDVTVGGRYEYERHKRSGGDATGSIASIDSDRTFGEFLPRIDLNWHPNETQSYGGLISKGYNAGGGGIATGSPNPFPIVHYQYDEETVWNFELYGRQEFLDGRLSLSQNLFYALYSDMQLPFDLTPNDTTDELFVVRNADRVVTYGAEIGASWDVTDQINLFGNLGLLHTKVEKFSESGIQGNALYNAPNVSANAGISWQRDGFSASLSARYSDSYYTDINNRARGKTDPYVVADAKIGYEYSNDFGKIRLFGEVSNIFDDDTAVAFYPGSTTAADTAVLQQPRTFRVGLSASF